MLQASKPANLSAFGIGAAVGVFFLVGLVVLFLGEGYFRARDRSQRGTFANAPHTNPSAFMAASMQGVIQKAPRSREGVGAAAPHRKGNAPAHTERLAKEVTRNMPAGLFGRYRTGIISSANPAAEQVLGISRVWASRR